MIRLEPISHDDLDRVSHIAVQPDQEKFCGTIGEHFSNLNPDFDFHIVLRDDVVVGFFKTDRAFHKSYPFARAGEIGVRGVMIDASEQGKGTGRAAMALLPAYARGLYPQATGLVLSVNTVNPAARAVYLAAGFVDEGELHHGGLVSAQHVLRLPFADPLPQTLP